MLASLSAKSTTSPSSGSGTSALSPSRVCPEIQRDVFPFSHSSKREAWDHANEKKREVQRWQREKAPLPWSEVAVSGQVPRELWDAAKSGEPERQSPASARHGRCGRGPREPVPGSAQGRDTELIVSVLLHNTVALTLCRVKILNCLFISHPLFILIVPDKQGHFTFVCSVRAYRSYLCRPRDFESLPEALVDAEEWGGIAITACCGSHRLLATFSEPCSPSVSIFTGPWSSHQKCSDRGLG